MCSGRVQTSLLWILRVCSCDKRVFLSIGWYEFHSQVSASDGMSTCDCFQILACNSDVVRAKTFM